MAEVGARVERIRSAGDILRMLRASRGDAEMARLAAGARMPDTREVMPDGRVVTWEERGRKVYIRVDVPPDRLWERFVRELDEAGFNRYAEREWLRAALVAAPAAKQYARDGLSLWLRGATGTRKSTLAVALALDAAHRGVGAAFRYWPVWRERLRDWESGGVTTGARAVDELVRSGRLIVVDELGFDGRRADWSDFDREIAQVLVSLADSRGAQLVVTTNMGEPERLAQLSAPTNRRIDDRARWRKIEREPAKGGG